MKKRVYIFNTLIVPIDFDRYQRVIVELSSLDIESAKKLLEDSDEVISAVGHESTAKLLSRLLGREIQMNRIQVRMEPMDTGIHFVLKARLPEGAVLSEEELQKLDFWLVQSTVIQ